MNEQSPQILTFEMDEAHMGERLDKVLASLCPDFSRARLQALIRDGQVKVNNAVYKKGSYRIENEDVVEIRVPELEVAEPQPQNIPLDIVYEDDDLIVINKAIGMVVHPGAGNYDGTMVNALLHHCGDSLSGIGGVMRPGIVHRLDKETSGLMVVAKHDRAHQGLAAQLEDRSLSRVYHALVLKVPIPLKGRIDQPIARHQHNRTKMAAVSMKSRAAKHAITNYLVLKNFKDALSLMECRLQTGRTHQIRVHMDSIGCPLIGDPLYGPQPTALVSTLKKAGYSDEIIEACKNFPRQTLHAKKIAFIHPMTEQHVTFESDMPEDIVALLNQIKSTA